MNYGNKDYTDFVERMGSFYNELSINTTNNTLAHHGVKGMKWGIRKKINVNHVKSGAQFTKSVGDLGIALKKNERTYSKKDVKKVNRMSDEELRTLSSRIELENRYLNAVRSRTGKTTTEKILSVIGPTCMVVSTGATLYGVIKNN